MFGIHLVIDNGATVDRVVDLSVFDKVIGQSSVLDQLKFYIEGYVNTGIFPTLLFKGSHGLGKTYVARQLAYSLGRRFVEVNCGSINSLDEFIGDVLLKDVIGEGDVTILLDESHKLNSDISVFLLSMLAPNSSGKTVTKYRNMEIIYDFRHINVVFATTDSYKMLGPLLNRCRDITFRLYNDNELKDLLSFYCGDLEFHCDLDSVISACRGRARNAVLLSEDLKNASNGNLILDQSEWETYCRIFGVNDYGIKDEEIEYLKIVKKSGHISSSNIAKRMGLNKNNIELDIEPRLMELNFVESTSRGRCLTSSGVLYLEDHLLSKQKSEESVKI
jgi:Holliday junction resolvasome RuvABC ATP-dependent DNA helicase subunit